MTSRYAAMTNDELRETNDERRTHVKQIVPRAACAEMGLLPCLRPAPYSGLLPGLPGDGRGRCRRVGGNASCGVPRAGNRAANRGSGGAHSPLLVRVDRARRRRHDKRLLHGIHERWKGHGETPSFSKNEKRCVLGVEYRNGRAIRVVTLDLLDWESVIPVLRKGGKDAR